MTSSSRDLWAEWILRGQFGGDAEKHAAWRDAPRNDRDWILDQANIDMGATVLDVGCGSGLVAFAALEKVGATGTVIFSDTSQELLDHCRAEAERRGVLGRCSFVRSAAEELAGIDERVVDALTARSVLAYLTAKDRAIQEFFRVLRPGGRISILEPIGRFAGPEPTESLWGYDATPIRSIAEKLRSFSDTLMPGGIDPTLDFDERDLFALTERAGFDAIHLIYVADIAPRPTTRWEEFLHVVGDPRVPSVAEAMERVLTTDEARQLTAYLRPLIEAGRGRAQRTAWALVSARKPVASTNSIGGLHRRLVDRLKGGGLLDSPPIEAAFRAVRRDLFLPGVPLEEVYSDRVIPTKFQDGRSISSSSQPAVMAIMLQQLGIEPGQRVLEVGTGTGYNAALIAQIVGETGEVISIDLDADTVDKAREHLAVAGYSRVRVKCADGWFGYPEAAPYDRIILTAATWDIAPAWRDQLRPGGRMVLPLVLFDTLQKLVAFELAAGCLASVSIKDGSFMPLRGAAPQSSDERLEIRAYSQENIGAKLGETVIARRWSRLVVGFGSTDSS
jgi:protein-L-isoaspartate(D-aspartate) O-methyltransferase